ncbi:MAG: hypothetical protein HUU50_03670 [Candidatus Brocadiae bacterium]|nr:hypothetical protein [Candidatus Brocadiia bacterium]
MDYRIGINLGWAECEDIILRYEEWFLLCKKYHITSVRIFLVEWGIGLFTEKAKMESLYRILEIAEKYKIEVLLVLETYVHFCKNTFCDFKNNEYSWKNYSLIYKCSIDAFFSKKKIIQDYLTKVITFLKSIEMYKMLYGIELCNEIDQIEANKKKVKLWLKICIDAIRQNFSERYVLSYSISDTHYYSMFKDIECVCDFHTYGFPYHTMLENIKYFDSLENAARVTEYARFSEESYTDLMSSKIYFAAGLWENYFRGKFYSPFSWWWEDILSSKQYYEILDFFCKIKDSFHTLREKKYSKMNIEIMSIISESKPIEKKLLLKKIKYRLGVIIKNPTFILREIGAIRKFLKKIFKKKYSSPFSFRAYSNISRDLYLFEAYVNVEIRITYTRNSIPVKIYIYNLVNGTVELLADISINELIVKVFGCVLIEFIYEAKYKK